MTKSQYFSEWKTQKAEDCSRNHYVKWVPWFRVSGTAGESNPRRLHFWKTDRWRLVLIRVPSQGCQAEQGSGNKSECTSFFHLLISLLLFSFHLGLWATSNCQGKEDWVHYQRTRHSEKNRWSLGQQFSLLCQSLRRIQGKICRECCFLRSSQQSFL